MSKQASRLTPMGQNTFPYIWSQLAVKEPPTRFFFFISTPFFSAQPGVAYRKAVFEPQVCLDVCLTTQTTFIYEMIKK